MAALLVAGSAQGGTRRRLSFRRVERWSEPPQGEGSKSKAKEAVELLLWSDVGEDCSHTFLSFATDYERRGADWLTGSQRSGSSAAVTTFRLDIDGPAGQSGDAF
jgi:hypothetical protein